MSNKQVQRRFEGHTSDVYCLIVWNNHLWSASLDKTIKGWNEEGKCISTLEGHTKSVKRLCVWRNNLYSASYDNTIREWNSQGKCVRVLQLSKNLDIRYSIDLIVWKNCLVSCHDDSIR